MAEKKRKKKKKRKAEKVEINPNDFSLEMILAVAEKLEIGSLTSQEDLGEAEVHKGAFDEVLTHLDKNVSKEDYKKLDQDIKDWYKNAVNAETLKEITFGPAGEPEEKKEEHKVAKEEKRKKKKKKDVAPKKEKKKAAPKAKVKKGENPFREGTKYAHVWGLLKKKPHTVGDLAKALTEKYGEATGKMGNVKVYLHTIRKRGYALTEKDGRFSVS